MDKKGKKDFLKTLSLYALFGIALAFAVTILFFWIYQGIAQPIPMALLIGVLVGMAIKLFLDALKREHKKD